MDEEVRLAMQRWPNVPAAWGWLKLDRRGQWHMIKRDAPGFDEASWANAHEQERSIVRNERLVEFINRNYEHDDQGRWYFQNGPQRAYVDLELAPWVLRIDHSGLALKWVTHTGEVAMETLAAFSDESGNLYVLTELGPGVIDDRQLARLEKFLVYDEAGTVWLVADPSHEPKGLMITPIDSQHLEATLGFTRKPRPA